MLSRIIMYLALVAIPIAGWLGYDYGVSKERDRSQSAADVLTDKSVELADKGEETKEKVRIVYRNVVKRVEVANDACLDRSPGPDIADSVRQLQSEAR